MDYKKVYENIQNNFRQYLFKSGLKAVVIGESGGLDSGAISALARPVCDELGVKLIGRYIGIETNGDDELERANAIGKAFCHDYKVIDMSHISVDLRTFVEEMEGMETDFKAIPRKIRNGNTKARLRMIYLYNLAQLHGGMVLSTDNLTEFMLGFWTLHGDVGDYGMIQYLKKTDVFGLVKWIALNVCGGTGSVCRNVLLACYDAIPKDGLGISKSDVEQLGAEDYYEVDDVLYGFIDAVIDDDLGTAEKLKPHPVVQRHFASQFKRSNPYNIPEGELTRGAT